MRRLLVVGILTAMCAAPAAADPTSDVSNAFLNFGKATSYHMSLASARGDVEIDVVNPNKKHIAIGSQAEMIMIADDAYMKIGGSWRKMPAMGMMAGRMARDYAHDYATKKRGSLNVTDHGMQSVDGESLHAYDVKDAESGSDVVIYVGADGYPHKIVPQGKAESASIRYSRFNDPAIRIDAPI